MLTFVFETDARGECIAETLFKAKCIETWMLEGDVVRFALFASRRRGMANRSRQTIDFTSLDTATSSNVINACARKAQGKKIKLLKEERV
jgi:hypothetical protein